MFSSLKVRNFRIYWFGMFISFVGTWIQTIAQSWLVFSLTDSAFLLGLVGFLGSIPLFVLSLFGGVVADRINKRIILLFTQNALMILAFVLAVLTQTKLITPLQIMLISLLNGVVLAFDAPARQVVIVELAGKERLLNAVALNSAAFNSARIIGPAIAGILVATIGMSGCFYVNGFSFLAAILALCLIKINNNTRNGRKSTALKDLKDGLVFMRSNPLILILLAMVGIVSLFGLGYLMLMPVVAKDILGVGIKGLGMLMSSYGIGALIAGLALARLGDFKYKGKLLVLSSIIFSVSLVLFSVSKAYAFSLFTLLLMGAFSVMAVSLINTLLQTIVSDEFRGRVMSVFMFTFAGIMPFGNLIAGSLSQAFGVSFTIMISGLVCTAFFILISIIYPGLRDV